MESNYESNESETLYNGYSRLALLTKDKPLKINTQKAYDRLSKTLSFTTNVNHTRTEIKYSVKPTEAIIKELTLAVNNHQSQIIIGFNRLIS